MGCTPHSHGQYGNFFDNDIMKWCCEHDGTKFIWRLDLAPQKEVFTACNDEKWDLFTYAEAYFTPSTVTALNIAEAAEQLNGVRSSVRNKSSNTWGWRMIVTVGRRMPFPFQSWKKGR